MINIKFRFHICTYCTFEATEMGLNKTKLVAGFKLPLKSTITNCELGC